MSEKFSFEGWNFLEWLKGNLNTIKEVIKVGTPLLFGMAVFKDNPTMIVLATAIGKLLLDSLHYFVAEQK